MHCGQAFSMRLISSHRLQCLGMGRDWKWCKGGVYSLAWGLIHPCLWHRTPRQICPFSMTKLGDLTALLRNSCVMLALSGNAWLMCPPHNFSHCGSQQYTSPMLKQTSWRSNRIPNQILKSAKNTAFFSAGMSAEYCWMTDKASDHLSDYSAILTILLLFLRIIPGRCTFDLVYMRYPFGE